MCCHHWQGKKNNRMFHKAPAYSKNPKGTEHYELQTVPTHLVAGQHHTTRGGLKVGRRCREGCPHRMFILRMGTPKPHWLSPRSP